MAEAHHLIAKNIFLCKRAQPDILLEIGFLSTRVKDPDIDDWKKLRNTMQYLLSTKKPPLTLIANDSRVVKWWSIPTLLSTRTLGDI